MNTNHTSSDDADYWHLSNHQRYHYHQRLHNYRWRMIESHADRAGGLWRVALTYALLILGLAAGTTIAILTVLLWGVL